MNLIVAVTLHSFMIHFIFQQYGCNYIDPAALDEAHNKCNSEVEAFVLSLEKEEGKQFVETCEQQLGEYLSHLYQSLQTQNENLKVFRL